MAQSGRNRKKAVILISDGNDTSSRRGLRDVRRVVRESEVLVYAIGIDGSAEPTIRMSPPTFPPPPIPFPFPIPDRRRPGTRWPGLTQLPRMSGRTAAGDRLNAQALRDITDDSGGRTEVVRDARDLSPATASIADELSRQYLTWLHQPRRPRRPLALHPRGSARRIGAGQGAPWLHRIVIARARMRTADRLLLQQRAAQDDEPDREIDHQARHIDESCDERRRRCCRIEPQPLQQERQQRSAQRPPQHHTNE